MGHGLRGRKVQVLEWTGHSVEADGSPKPALSLCYRGQVDILEAGPRVNVALVVGFKGRGQAREKCGEGKS